MDKDYAQYLLEKTIENYNLIAEDFSSTREYVPEERKKLLLRYITAGDKVLDLGCGNGRFYEATKGENIDYMGIDNSEKMIEIAKRSYPEAKFQIADALNPPFPENFFDVIFCFAVFHHIPSEELRRQFLTEIRKILRPGGTIILTVWNLNPLRMFLIGQPKRAKDFFRHQALRIIGKSKLDLGDFFVSWRSITPRYIHCFTINGLRKIVKKADLKIKKSGILKDPKSKESNVYIIAQK